MKNQQDIQLAFNFRHQNGQQFMTFTRIFIANDIDKIYTLSNESALFLGRVMRVCQSLHLFVFSFATLPVISLVKHDCLETCNNLP
jgi:hypothetical protein